jgi:hypothetical protein
MDGRDRRQHPRFEGQFRVDLLNMGDDPLMSPWEPVVPATALDISRAGMRLASQYNATVGSRVSTVVYYKGFDSLCLCEVVWKRVENGRYLYGMFIKEWSQLDPALERQLKAMELEEQRAKDSDLTPTAGAVVTNLQPA